MALEDLVAFGTDGEYSLSEAQSTCFTKATISAASHFEGNVKIKPFACNRLQTIPVGSI